MASEILSVRLEPQLVAKLGKMAAVMDRPRAWLMAHAIRTFVEHEEWFIEAVQAALKDIDEGKTIDHDLVEAWVSSWNSDDEVEIPRWE